MKKKTPTELTGEEQWDFKTFGRNFFLTFLGLPMSAAKTTGDPGLPEPEDEGNDHAITAACVRDPIGEASSTDPPVTEPFLFSREDLKKHEENVRDSDFKTFGRNFFLTFLGLPMSAAKTMGDPGLPEPEDEGNDHAITAACVRDPIGEASSPDPPDTEPFLSSREDLRKHDENVRDEVLLELVAKHLAIGTPREVISKTLFLTEEKFVELVKKSKSDRRKVGPR